ncbi:MAG: hypothetical protein VKK04_17250 [Synechococcales bacterium]|nr:hypothetical protein [Synechococcales bacterium]
MSSLNLSTKPASVRRRARWFEKIMAALVLVNVGLVFFDYSYIPLRDYYLRFFPEFTDWYGRQFKGIEPHRVTTAYLETVDEFEQQVAETGLSSPAAAALLSELRDRSAAIIDENPFEIANKSGTLERIKERMLERIEETTDLELESSKESFRTFWDVNYLSEHDYRAEMAFFDERIRPLIATNYYRSIDAPLLGSSGIPTDRFIKIDIWFIGIFAAEFLARTWWLSRRYRDTSWLDAMLWRWYDVFLLLPFWRWLRVIPLITRINQSNLIDLEPLRNRITHGIIASFAVEITEVVVIRVIDQLQNLIKQGDITRALLRPETLPRYIDLNDVDEIKVITQRIVSTLTYQVLPSVRSDIEALLRHNIANALKAVPVYQGIQSLPGGSSLTEQLTQQVVSELYATLYSTLTHTLEDEVGAELTQKLLADVGDTFRREIQKDRAVEEIEALVGVWLDEVKINYVKRLASEDVEQLREQTLKLYAITQGSKP